MITKERLIKNFLEMVSIDSTSGNEDAMAKFLIEKLESLGGKTDTDSFGNIVAKFQGKGAPFMLNAHIDTVEPGNNIKPVINGDIINTDGTTVLGADPKAGVAAILEAIESLKEEKKEVSLEVVFTRSEEIGLLGAKNLDYSMVTSRQGLTFDGEERVTNVTISAPGYNRVDATITGRSAHAGAEPEKGISAIQIASKIISQLQLGRIDHETTANVGLIEGGSARNAVPESAHFKAEIRSRDREKLALHARHFQDVFDSVMKEYPEAKVDLEIVREFDPYRFSETHTVIERAKSSFVEMGITPNISDSGGGTDVNIFHTNGIEAIVVGTGDYNAHTKREYAKISEMVEAAVFCEKFLLA